MTEQDQRSVVDATERFYEALNSMLAGDPEPLTEVYSHADDVTYMPAQGGILVGWEQVFGDWSKQAAASHGGIAEAGPVRVVAGGDMAISRAETTGTVTGADGAVRRTRLRESSAFRKENGAWRMIAHHADEISAWEDVVRGED